MVLAMSPPIGMVSPTSGRGDWVCAAPRPGPCAAVTIARPTTHSAVTNPLFIGALPLISLRAPRHSRGQTSSRTRWRLRDLHGKKRDLLSRRDEELVRDPCGHVDHVALVHHVESASRGVLPADLSRRFDVRLPELAADAQRRRTGDDEHEIAP